MIFYGILNSFLLTQTSSTSKNAYKNSLLLFCFILIISRYYICILEINLRLVVFEISLQMFFKLQKMKTFLKLLTEET